MTWIILQLLFPVMLLVLPAVLYKSKRPCMVRFYSAMACRETVRKFYTQIVLVVLLVFHYIYMNGHGGHLGILVTTVLCIFLFSHNRTHRLLTLLRDNRQIFYFAGLFALVTLFMPQMYTVSVSLGIILLAASFYPSSIVIRDWKKIESEAKESGDNSRMTNYYYANHHADCHDKVDSGNDTTST